jgi:hypothetical protein
VVRFRVNVIGGVGAGFYFSQLTRGASVEEVANARLALMFDGIRARIVCRIKERLGEGKGAAFSVDASEDSNEFAGLLKEPGGVRSCVWESKFLGRRRGRMTAAWSMRLERRVVNFEARVSRSSV